MFLDWQKLDWTDRGRRASLWLTYDPKQAEAHVIVTWETFVGEDGVAAVAGTDGGKIVVDEEYDGCARITLELFGDGPPCSITCGIYEWMMHTRRFSSVTEGRSAFETMKLGLADIVDMIPNRSDPERDAKIERVTTAITRFVDAFS